MFYGKSQRSFVLFKKKNQMAIHLSTQHSERSLFSRTLMVAALLKMLLVKKWSRLVEKPKPPPQKAPPQMKRECVYMASQTLNNT